MVGVGSAALAVGMVERKGSEIRPEGRRAERESLERLRIRGHGGAKGGGSRCSWVRSFVRCVALLLIISVDEAHAHTHIRAYVLASRGL